jgi:hypothetical protein
LAAALTFEGVFGSPVEINLISQTSSEVSSPDFCSTATPLIGKSPKGKSRMYILFYAGKCHVPAQLSRFLLITPFLPISLIRIFHIL